MVFVCLRLMVWLVFASSTAVAGFYLCLRKIVGSILVLRGAYLLCYVCDSCVCESSLKGILDNAASTLQTRSPDT